MSKLKLTDIIKTYRAGDTYVRALKGVSLEFRESEFVSVLGPSGCGKTTLLNVIGGLDHYDSGDLQIGNVSTKKYKDADWDAYRNRSIGFVFQNYNLISHQTVLQNVEISMTLSGISASERKKRAIESLKSVGLEDQINKKPNQLSGGQMQRVAIARALVNNPDIILADEPTGALDSKTSISIMEILKNISKTRLVIMVTHNASLANEYSDRIISLLDGKVVSDTNPYEDDNVEVKEKKTKKTSMSMLTAASLSFKNLLTKKGRTIITSFAGSIGIIGVALVLALSNGLSSYMSKMQSDALSGFPLKITTDAQYVDFAENEMDFNNFTKYEKFPKDNVLHSYNRLENLKTHTNVLTDEYLKYVEDLKTVLPNAVNNITYIRSVSLNVLAKGQDTVVKFPTQQTNPMGIIVGASTHWQELPDNEDFILSLYELIGENSRMPQNKNEVLLVVDKYNRIDSAFFEKLGITDNTKEYKLTDFIGKEIFKIIPNNDYYKKADNLYVPATPLEYSELYNSENAVPLKITGILRIKESASGSYLSEGIAYTTALTDYFVADSEKSDIAAYQSESDVNVITSIPFKDEAEKKQMLLALGADTTPTGIDIYPKDFESKDLIKKYLSEYNVDKTEENKINFTDMAELVTSLTKTLLNTVTYVLTGFAAISLLVSTIMIGIITYVSVIERTKEIGILRSVGARKKDIARVFDAEALIIGLTAGFIGIGLSYLLCIPINLIVYKLVNITPIAVLNPLSAVLLVLGSMALTLIAGLFPASMAAKKDPVLALRTE